MCLFCIFLDSRQLWIPWVGWWWGVWIPLIELKLLEHPCRVLTPLIDLEFLEYSFHFFKRDCFIPVVELNMLTLSISCFSMSWFHIQPSQDSWCAIPNTFWCGYHATEMWNSQGTQCQYLLTQGTKSNSMIPDGDGATGGFPAPLEKNVILAIQSQSRIELMTHHDY